MEFDDAADIEISEEDLFEIRRPWRLRWSLWKQARRKKMLGQEREPVLRCLEVVVERGGLDPEFDPSVEERFGEGDVELALDLLEPLFTSYSLSIEDVALRLVSDDGVTEITSVMVTFY